MSTLVNNLHTAIRRYCFERYAYWTSKYSELGRAGRDRMGSRYTDEALSTFPRNNVLEAIRQELERYRPEDFSDLEEARAFFQLAAMQAENSFTKSHLDGVKSKAMAEEREVVANFIGNLSEEDLVSVEPLPYCRVLGTEEGAILRKNLLLRWGIDKDYWFPLSDEPRPARVEAFQDKYFEKEVGEKRIRAILEKHGVGKIWEILEGDVDYEIDVTYLRPQYTGVEGIWFDDDLDWIIYASHERSITIGGWLLDEVKAIWPNWEERVWTTWEFD